MGVVQHNTLSDGHEPKTHSTSHEDGGADIIVPALHAASRHASGMPDEILASHLPDHALRHAKGSGLDALTAAMLPEHTHAVDDEGGAIDFSTVGQIGFAVRGNTTYIVSKVAGVLWRGGLKTIQGIYLSSDTTVVGTLIVTFYINGVPVVTGGVSIVNGQQTGYSELIAAGDLTNGDTFYASITGAPSAGGNNLYMTATTDTTV